ncbi:MAG: Lrp/AsnC family transcriptional regulator [Phreatobacter sp.]|uniref:Lrp/AsnC family transcriptional regulator n=1 Tax=Phreatobacter sp. TaxID=1966341 RepID=UPI002735B8AB|nr:Lrp/AsnC family transcriptional regulator [Phreatobacter sp.]MDP2804232.1 Lrp/AsnC family transcriptional regulator [Phreatobacter sp.]
MNESVSVDGFDLRLLYALQEDGARTNQQLADLVRLSASQVSRRRQRLEEEGLIRRYRADLDAARLGFGVTVYIFVSLATHSGLNAKRFGDLVRAMPEVQEAHAMTGDADYLLKLVVRDLKGLSILVNEELLPHESVARVRSSIVLETLKDQARLPLLPRPGGQGAVASAR